MHNNLQKTHGKLKFRSIFVDSHNFLKIWDLWVSELFEQNVFTLSNLEINDNLENKNKDKNFGILLLRKMLLGNISVKESKIYEKWDESLQKLIEKITTNQNISIEDFMVKINNFKIDETMKKKLFSRNCSNFCIFQPFL